MVPDASIAFAAVTLMAFNAGAATDPTTGAAGRPSIRGIEFTQQERRSGRMICQPTSHPMCSGTGAPSLGADLGYNEPTIASLLGHKTHSITSRYVHSADAVLQSQQMPSRMLP